MPFVLGTRVLIWCGFLGLVARNEEDRMPKKENGRSESGSKPKLLSGGNPQIAIQCADVTSGS